jgi:APA family basic amino acid/polyamine antiporter
MIMTGIVIGSGIFVTTGIMAKNLPSAGMILFVWGLGGLITLAGALTYAELAAAMPEAGGQYVYLKEAYGRVAGFLFGWLLFFVYMSGGIAGLAAAFAEYFGGFFPALAANRTLFLLPFGFLGSPEGVPITTGKIVGLAVILVLSASNYVGVGIGKVIQNVSTVLKIGGVLVFIAVGFSFGRGSFQHFTVYPAGLDLGEALVTIGLALIAVSWAFDGWNNLTFVGSEIENPGRNLPRALMAGTLGVTVLYLLVNLLYLYALQISELAGVVQVAEKAAVALFSPATATVISGVVLVAIFGALNGSILVGPRIYYAMARDGLFFRSAATVHSRFLTPANAIVAQAIWSCVLILSGTFEEIITFAMFVAIIFWVAAACAVFTLRKKRPDLPRPYKAWGYPVVPAVFIIASCGILLNTIMERPIESLAGLGITLLGVPAYLYWSRGSRNLKSRAPRSKQN